MNTMFLVFSHELTDLQKKDAEENFHIENFISLPEKLQKNWSNVPPNLSTLKRHLREVKDWLKSKAQPGDFVLIQGDYGAVYLLVDFSRQIGLKPVYSTTKREAIDTVLPDGKVQLARTFSHVRFREYEEFD